MTTLLLTAFTLIAFAANSLLCRLALGGEVIDPLSFTALRLGSGALVLFGITRLVARRAPARKAGMSGGSWGSGLALFAYAIAFSLAYVSLGAGVGALILFGAVQVTMMGAALGSGERPRPAQWAGAATAVAGLVYLVFPGLTAPEPVGALLMAVAGVAWGVYSLRGRGASAPVLMTAGNFLRAAPLGLLSAAVAAALALSPLRLHARGVVLALVSGVVTSGLGYVLWYAALRGLTTTQASVVQLLVPVIAAAGGVALLSERVTARLALASVLILGGVALAVVRRERAPAPAALAPEPE